MAIDKSTSYGFGRYDYVVTRGGYANPNETTSDWEDSYLNWRDGSAKNPNWKDDIKNGNCATTFLQGEKHIVKYAPTFVSARDVGGAEYFGYWAGRNLRHHISDAPQGYDISTLDDLAKTDLIRKANKVIRPFQGGVFLGELGETLRLIANPANGLIREILEYRKRAAKAVLKGKPSQAAKTASNLWLEASFGWTPLLSDIEDGVKALTRWDDPSKRSRIVVGRSEVMGPRYLEYSEFVNSPPFRYTYEVYRNVKARMRYRASIRFDPSHQEPWKYSGLSLSDVPVVAWELIPYSFLADYFTNIGDIIEGWSFNKSYINWVDRGYEVTYLRNSRIVNPRFYSDYWQNPDANQEDYFDFRGEELSAQRRFVSRNKVDNFDSVPSFHWEVPGFGKKAINIAALLASRTL